MFPMTRHHCSRRRRLLGLLAGGCVLAAGCLGSCGRDSSIRQQAFVRPGVPGVRVRLTGRPVESAVVATTGAYRLEVDGRAASQSADPLRATTVKRSGADWRFGSLTATGRELVLEPASPDSFVRHGRLVYRGTLHLLPAGDDRFVIVNHVDLENYLAGVLAKELYPHWSPVTYRAQAIAARTFALYHMTRFGASHDHDLGDDQASQVYGGLSAETDKSQEAVRQTYGVVLTYGPAGRERIFMAQYSACCGGQVNGAGVIRDAPPIEPLAGGQMCDHCRNCPRYRWGPVLVPKSDIYRALALIYAEARELGGVSEVRPVSAASRGRAVWVDVVGPAGKSIRLRTADVRIALLRAGVPAAGKLYSTNCRLRDAGDAIEFAEGRGFGHGVGLCQWGAEGKAAAGWTAEQILRFYYPGAKLFRAY